MKKMRIFALLCVIVLLCGTVSTAALAADYGYAGKKGSITLTEDSSAGLAIGDTLQLKVSKDTIASCKSSTPKYATVSATGLVTAKKAGKTAITVNTNGGSTFTLNVTVVDPKKPSGIKLTKKSITTYVGMKTDLKPYVKGKPYADVINISSLTWKSSNENVVKVKKGVITAQGTGTAKVTVTAKNKESATFTVKVKKNKINNISEKPRLSAISGYNHALYLKSVEIVSPKKVVLEYYLLFTYPSWYKATSFSYIDSHVYYYDDNWDSVTLVDGEATKIRVSLKGQSVGTFKVTYSGSSVKNTNIKLSKLKNKIYCKWSSFLYYEF